VNASGFVGRVLAADAPPQALSALGRLGVAVDRG